jgi:uncharacterized protein
MFDPNQRRLLALDGGGILGVVSLQILKRIEDQLRPLSGKGDDFRLRDFFDYFGGTSTGAIIAAGLALGRSVDELNTLYEDHGSAMFSKSSIWLRWLYASFKYRPVMQMLKREIGEQSIAELQAAGKLSKDKHLLIVTQRMRTDSPWPLSTNPRAKYNDKKRPDCNLNIPLWKVVRASTAAPTYYAPQPIEIDPGQKEPDLFEDGGVTPYNNPSMLLYRMATLPEYNCEWPASEKSMMLVSVGTGCTINPYRGLRLGRWILANARSIPSGLLQRMSTENDTLCRIQGRCVFGAPIDSEIGDLVNSLANGTEESGKLFLYARYDPDLSDKGLRKLGLSGLEGKKFKIDDASKANVTALKCIGNRYAEAIDFPHDFATFMPQNS